VRQSHQGYSARAIKRLILRKKRKCKEMLCSTTEVALYLPASRMALGCTLDSMAG
jgi:hypothetical protein